MPPLNREYSRAAMDAICALFDGLSTHHDTFGLVRRNRQRERYNSPGRGYRQKKSMPRRTLPIDARAKSCGS